MQVLQTVTILLLLVLVFLPYNGCLAFIIEGGDYVLSGITDGKGRKVPFPFDEGPFLLTTKKTNKGSNNKELYSISIVVTNTIWTNAEIIDDGSDGSRAAVKIFPATSTRMGPWTDEQAKLESDLLTMLPATKSIVIEQQTADDAAAAGGHDALQLHFVGNKGTLTFQQKTGGGNNDASSETDTTGSKIYGQKQTKAGNKNRPKRNKKKNRRKNNRKRKKKSTKKEQ